MRARTENLTGHLRHLSGCPEPPRTETYTAAGMIVARCIDCGAHLVTQPDGTIKGDSQ